MNHLDVMLIGVGPTVDDEPFEPFVYSVNAPTNLWVGALTEQGTRMGLKFMASILNGLIEDDCFQEGMTFVDTDQNGTVLTARVGEEVPADEVQAYQADTDTVRKVTVAVG